MKSIGLLNALLAAAGSMDFGASRAIAEINNLVPTSKVTGRLLWNPRSQGTYVTAEGKTRMAARKSAYKSAAIANDLFPARGKPKQRGVKLQVASGGFHCQYNKLGTLRELQKLTAN